MSAPKLCNTTLKTRRTGKPLRRPSARPNLSKHAAPHLADPCDLAITVATARFLQVLGRLGQHSDFIERALVACNGLLVWPNAVLDTIDSEGDGASVRAVPTVCFDEDGELESSEDEDTAGPASASSRWNCLVDPTRLDSVPQRFFRKLNADPELRRQVGTATMEWAQSCPVAAPEVLQNANYMAEAFDLGDEGRRLIELIILVEMNSAFEDALVQLDFGKRHEAERMLARYLGCDQRIVARLIDSDGPLARIGLIEPDQTSGCLGGILSTSGSIFSRSITREHGSTSSFLESFLMPSAPAKLDDADTEHLAAIKEFVVPLLRSSVQKSAVGVNLMFHGAPGTGKTELARQVAQHAGLKLYEVRYADAVGSSLSAQQRLASLLLNLQALRGKRDAAILLDEAEDVFSSCEHKFRLGGSKPGELSKAWITRLLEENGVPILWTSNQVWQMDPAVVRRFAVVYEFAELPRSVKLRMADKYLGDLDLPTQRLEQVAGLSDLSPAQLENASRATRLAGPRDPAQSWQFVRLQINESRRAMGQAPVREVRDVAVAYDPTCLNLSGGMTPDRLLTGLRANGRAALCFHGVPGTGKTELAHHIARQMDRELIVQSASDLLSKWVGETEQRIARMFQRAADRSDRVVLLLDEADTFLKDRAHANASWELSQTNEFLARMEAFPGIFICTTNLLDKLDPAILRRFQFRVEFLGLQPAQAQTLFTSAFGRPPTASETAALRRLDGQLAPADFSNVARQLSFLGQPDDAMPVTERLAQEVRCRLKGAMPSRPVGFVH